MMNRNAFGLSALFFIVFFVTAALIPPDPMVEILSAGIFVAAAFGLWRWGPAAFRVYVPVQRFPAPDRETSLGVLGLVLWLISEAGKRVYSVTYLQMDRPEWMQDLHVSAFLNAVTLVGLVLVIAATRFPGEHPSKMPGLMAAIAAFFGVLFSAALPFIIAKVGALAALMAKLGLLGLSH